MISTNQEATQLPTATNMAELEEETVPSILLPCTSCNRTFRPEALQKHIRYCEKSLIKKRKVFDSAKQRIQGTDLAEFLPVLTHKKKNEKSPVRKTQSKWKEKHMELVRAIRAARTGPSEILPSAPLKPCDHEKCLYCDRYFGPKAYDRHLEWCKEHCSRIQPKSPASIQAKERLEARTKYRAPVLAKSRRTLIREKYQLGGNQIRDPSPMNNNQKIVSSRIREPSPSERLHRNIINPQISPKQATGFQKGDSNTSEAFSRQQLLRNSRRNPSPMKKTPTPSVKPKSSENNGNIILSPKEKNHEGDVNVNITTSSQEISVNTASKGKEDIFRASCNITSIQPKATPRSRSNRMNHSALPNHLNRSLENYDPYKSAERQMKELLELDDVVSGEVVNHPVVKETEKQKELISVLPADNISSPTSAFAKFTPIQSPIPSDDNDNHIPPPSKFGDSIQNSPPPSIVENRRYIENRRSSLASGDAIDLIQNKNLNPISLSSLSLCSTISIDSIDSYKNNFKKGLSASAKVQSFNKRTELPLKRSISAVDSHRKGRDFMKGNLKMEDLLYGFSNDNFNRFLGTPVDDVDSNDTSSFENLTLSNESLKTSDSNDDTSRAEQELLKSMSEFEKLFESPSLKPVPPLISSSSPDPVPKSFPSLGTAENNKQQSHQQLSGNKLCLDSAYNSLNRKSPQLENPVVIENSSSSGSESPFPLVGGLNSQVARFCHECGTKYPVLAAKFCCNCGVRRLVI